MNKIYGATVRQDGLVQIGRSKWELFYGYGTENGSGYNWRQMYRHNPTKAEIKEAIEEVINEQVQETILSGLEYENNLVWLSAENQRNYTAHATQLLNDETILPITEKLGTDAAPVLVEFKTKAEYMTFYNAVSEHISSTINAGWKEKINIDWTTYGK